MMSMLSSSTFSFLQNCLNLSETKYPPESDIIFLGKPYSENIILHASFKLPVDRYPAFLWLEIGCDNLQCKDRFCYLN